MHGTRICKSFEKKEGLDVAGGVVGWSVAGGVLAVVVVVSEIAVVTAVVAVAAVAELDSEVFIAAMPFAATPFAATPFATPLPGDITVRSKKSKEQPVTTTFHVTQQQAHLSKCHCHSNYSVFNENSQILKHRL